MIAHPNDLRLVAVQHLDLFVNVGRYIHIFGGVEINTAKGVHIKYGNKESGEELVR